MKKLLYLLLPLLLGLVSCETSTETQDEFEIRNIIYDVAQDFSWNDIDAIMAFVHPQYRHNGMTTMQLREFWLDRRAQYDLLDCDVTSVTVNEDLATVSMQMTFQSSTGTLSYPEPETSGETSYFYYSGGSWKIYGNQELARP